MNEHAFTFQSRESHLVGIYHPTEAPASTAVLIIVGGPQTRVGSHRQFVLLSRLLARQGIPTMRFDYMGMGDSDGNEANYLDVTDDIDAAITELKNRSGVSNVVLWGLCDAASSALIYVKHRSDSNISGLVILNPWVRSEQGEAKAIVKHYYADRLRDPEFWRKVLSLKFDVLGSLKSLLDNIRKSRGKVDVSQTGVVEASTEENYIGHMREGLERCSVPILLITSGNDLTAAEFLDLVKSDDAWQRAVEARIKHHETLPEANHTFSSQSWRQQVEQLTLNWVKAR